MSCLWKVKERPKIADPHPFSPYDIFADMREVERICCKRIGWKKYLSIARFHRKSARQLIQAAKDVAETSVTAISRIEDDIFLKIAVAN